MAERAGDRDGQHPTGGRDRLESLRGLTANVVTIVAFVAFLLLVTQMYANRAGSAIGDWDRQVYLLTGLEAVTFAGIGWLFGKEVHRRQAEQSERNAQAAVSANKEAAAAKAAGQALAQSVRAKAAKQPSATKGGRISQASAATPAPSQNLAADDLQELNDLADRLFPPTE